MNGYHVLNYFEVFWKKTQTVELLNISSKINYQYRKKKSWQIVFLKGCYITCVTILVNLVAWGNHYSADQLLWGNRNTVFVFPTKRGPDSLSTAMTSSDMTSYGFFEAIYIFHTYFFNLFLISLNNRHALLSEALCYDFGIASY